MAVEDRLADLAIRAIDNVAKDRTCKKCEHLTSRQLSIILAIGGGFNHGPCDSCKNGSNFKAKS